MVGSDVESNASSSNSNSSSTSASSSGSENSCDESDSYNSKESAADQKVVNDQSNKKSKNEIEKNIDNEEKTEQIQDGQGKAVPQAQVSPNQGDIIRTSPEALPAVETSIANDVSSNKSANSFEAENVVESEFASTTLEGEVLKNVDKIERRRSNTPRRQENLRSRSGSENRGRRRRSRTRERSVEHRRSLSRNKNTKRTCTRSRSPKRRSRTRSPERRRHRSRSRSRSPRAKSLERRREERKRRHAERNKQENANRGGRDSRSPRRKSNQNPRRGSDRSPRRVNDRSSRQRRSPSKSANQDKPDNIALDNATVTDPKAKITERQRRTVDLLTSRTGGAYIPPAKLRMMQAEITDKASAAYQRIAWEALKKSIHGYINKVNVDNIAIITRELLKENIVRGRGLLCRSIIQAQAASPTFTHVYAALVSIINSKFPKIGELLLTRLVIQFKRAFRRNDKAVCLSASRFVAHLVNQRVAHEILALETLTLLVETPTDDSVEVAIAFLKECGMKLSEVSSKGIGAIFEMLKNILHEGKLEKRVQYMIEVVFQVRKDGFKDHPSVPDALDLVEEDDQFTHLLMLDDATNTEDVLNAFKFDEKYAENEGKYKGLSREILGSDLSDEESGSTGSDSDLDDSDPEDGEDGKTAGDIIDNTETNLIALRRTIYLTINSSLDYEECAHKLVKMQLKPGQEIELCHMFLDCCAEQRTYEKFYGLLAQRFCTINKIYVGPFEEIFRNTYQTTHRLDTNRLRNVSKFFAHLLFTDAISWDVLECIQLNEDDTTSSSRIFVKILFQELAEYMGLSKLNSKLKEDVLAESLAGLFPKDNPRNTRFSINFFTSIGLGGLTDDLRRFLKNAPKVVPAINEELIANKPVKAESSEENSSTASLSSSSSSGSSSESETSSTSSSENESESSDSEPKCKRRRNDELKKVAKRQKISKKERNKNDKKQKEKGKKADKRKNRAQKNQSVSKNKKKRRRESSSSSSSSSASSSESDASSSESSDSGGSTSSSDDDQLSKQKSLIKPDQGQPRSRNEHHDFDLSGPIANRRQQQLNGSGIGKINKKKVELGNDPTPSEYRSPDRRDDRDKRCEKSVDGPDRRTELRGSGEMQRRREQNNRNGRVGSRHEPNKEVKEPGHIDKRGKRRHDEDNSDGDYVHRVEHRSSRVGKDEGQRREHRDVKNDEKSRKQKKDDRGNDSRNNFKECG